MAAYSVLFSCVLLGLILAAAAGSAPATCDDYTTVVDCFNKGLKIGNASSCGWCSASQTCEQCFDADCNYAVNNKSSCSFSAAKPTINWFPATYVNNNSSAKNVVGDCLQFSFSRDLCVKQGKHDGYYCGFANLANVTMTTGPIFNRSICWPASKIGGMIQFANVTVSLDGDAVLAIAVAPGTIEFKGAEKNSWIIAVAVGACILAIAVASLVIYLVKRRQAAAYNAFE